MMCTALCGGYSEIQEVLFIMPLFTGKCMLTNLVSNAAKRKSADRAEGQKADIWHSRLSKIILAHSLH